MLGVRVGGQLGPDRLELREPLLGFAFGLPQQGAAALGAEGMAEEKPEHERIARRGWLVRLAQQVCQHARSNIVTVNPAAPVAQGRGQEAVVSVLQDQ